MRRKPSGCGSAKTASSKSRASSPSMVTSGSSRRSMRAAAARGSTCAPNACASRSAAAGNSHGRSKRAMADSVASSTGRSGSKRLSTTPCAGLAEPAWRVTLAITQSPPRAPSRSAGATAQRSCSRRSAAFTQALRPWISTVPRKAVTPRSSTSSTVPDQRSVASRASFTRSRSPCITPRICGGEMKTPSLSPSMRTKP